MTQATGGYVCAAGKKTLAEGSRVGIGIQVEGLTKSFGPQRIWEDVTFEIPAGEVSVLLGPSGTGKSVFLKSLIGLLRPERGKIIVDGTNIIECSAKELYEIRTLFGVMFQDGALFGSMSLYDNTAFPLRDTEEEGIRDPSDRDGEARPRWSDR